MVFKNELALKADFLPDSLPCREAQLKEMVFALQPAFEGRKAKNLFLSGPPGTGKTSCAKLVFRQLAEESGKATPVFINCWQHPSRQAVLAEIASALGEPMPRRGLGADEMLSRISSFALNQKISCVVALDECDRLLHNNDDVVLYDLLRSGFVSAIACVTNDNEFTEKIDERAKSSLQPLPLGFKRYSPLELKKILRERAEMAFAPNAWSEELIAVVAAYSSKMGGDARIALEALWQCGKNAEARDSNKIEKRDFEELKENPSQSKRLAGAGELEEKIIGVLRKNKGTLSAGELYEKTGEPERTVRNYLKLLENKRVVSLEKKISKKGQTTIVTLLV
jgi:cell division control protein 6